MSEAEESLAGQLRLCNFPPARRQYRFAWPARGYLADFAWPERGLIVEVQGGGYGHGRHHRAQGYRDDCERMAHALARGWRVLYVTPADITSGDALRWIRDALRAPDRPAGQDHAEEASGGPTPARRSRRRRQSKGEAFVAELVRMGIGESAARAAAAREGYEA